jgi:3-methyl-2-oxobutanoate hydroxymethyltransferase
MEQQPMTTARKLKSKKSTGEKFTALVLYDHTFCRSAAGAAVDVVVVGDSVSMLLFGHDTTVKTTMDMMVYHTKAVASAVLDTLVISDLPYMSYSDSEEALQNAKRLMQAGAGMVKIEGGGAWVADIVRHLVARGIPVCGHIGLTPQYFHQIGAHKVLGRSGREHKDIVDAARRLDAAGIEMLVLECIPESLGSEITESVKALTLGAGASRGCNGQVMNVYDLIGLTGAHIKFSKNYLGECGSISSAIEQFVHDVKNRTFPSEEHVYV